MSRPPRKPVFDPATAQTILNAGAGIAKEFSDKHFAAEDAAYAADKWTWLKHGVNERLKGHGSHMMKEPHPGWRSKDK